MNASPDGINGLFGNPSDENHARIRKKLSPGFSDKALRENETILQTHIDQLVKRLIVSAGKPQDLLLQFDQTTFGITCHLAFGQPFDML